MNRKQTIEAFARICKNAWAAGITTADAFTLALIDAAPVRMREIASVRGITPAAATGCVERLEDRSLARRIHGEHDRRVVFAEITDHGREMLGIVMGKEGRSI